MSEELKIRFKWKKYCEDCEFHDECDKSPEDAFRCFLGELTPNSLVFNEMLKKYFVFEGASDE